MTNDQRQKRQVRMQDSCFPEAAQAFSVHYCSIELIYADLAGSSRSVPTC